MDIAILLHVIIYIIVQIDLKADSISSDADLVWPFDDSDEESFSTLQQNEPVGPGSATSYIYFVGFSTALEITFQTSRQCHSCFAKVSQVFP